MPPAARRRSACAGWIPLTTNVLVVLVVDTVPLCGLEANRTSGNQTALSGAPNDSAVAPPGESWHTGEVSYQHVILDCDGPFATVTLNRPDKRNALALDVMLEVTEAFRAVGSSSSTGAILAANGPVFSAGHNFADMAGADLDHITHLFEVCTEMMNTIQEIPQPVVARVHALATAAGCQLVASCDLAVAADS